MALSVPQVVSFLTSATDANAYTGSSGTPAAYSLLLAFVGAEQTTNPVTTPTVANAPWALTWARDSRGDNAWTNTGATRRHGFIFYAATGATSPGADTFDIDFGGVTHIGAETIVVEIAGADLSGGPLAALVQLQIASGSGTAYTGGTLSAAANTANRTFAFYAHNTNTSTITQEGGYTELLDQNHLAPTITTESCWNPTAFDTTPTASSATSQVWGGWGLEIAAAPFTPYKPGLVVPQAVKRASVY